MQICWVRWNCVVNGMKPGIYCGKKKMKFLPYLPSFIKLSSRYIQYFHLKDKTRQVLEDNRLYELGQ